MDVSTNYRCFFIIIITVKSSEAEIILRLGDKFETIHVYHKIETTQQQQNIYRYPNNCSGVVDIKTVFMFTDDL